MKTNHKTMSSESPFGRANIIVCEVLWFSVCESSAKPTSNSLPIKSKTRKLYHSNAIKSTTSTPMLYFNSAYAPKCGQVVGLTKITNYQGRPVRIKHDA